MPLLAPVLGIGAEAGYEPVAAEGRKLYELIAQAVQPICWPAWATAPGWWWPRMCTGSIRPPWRFSARC